MVRVSRHDVAFGVTLGREEVKNSSSRTRGSHVSLGATNWRSTRRTATRSAGDSS
jgi:hypothetical protein